MFSAKVETQKEWVSHPQEEYLKAIDQMVHQSFKTVNTNCLAGGVRIGNDQAVSLPYVSARTLMGAGQSVLLDRIASVRSSVICSQVQRVDQGKTLGAPEQEVEWIRQALGRARERGKVFCTELSPRLRQILLPKEDGSYLSVSPISVAGLSERLRVLVVQKARAISEMREQNNPVQESMRPIETCELTIGGSNFQNAVGLAAIRNMISIEPPSDHVPNKALLSLYNEGVVFDIPKPLMSEYILWRKGLMDTANLSRDEDAIRKQLVRRIAKHLLRLGADALELLEQNKTRLPDQNLLNPFLCKTRRGLVDPSSRYAGWPLDFASLTTDLIVAIDLHRKTSPPYTQGEIRALTTIAQESVE